MLIVAVPYFLQAMGASFEIGIVIVVVASGLWYGWRRLRTHPA